MSRHGSRPEHGQAGRRVRKKVSLGIGRNQPSHGSAYIVLGYKNVACIALAFMVMVHIVMAYIVMAHIVMAHVAMANIVMAYIVMAYKVMAYI